VGFKFTVPLYTDTDKNFCSSADSDWVYWDGMQIVEGLNLSGMNPKKTSGDTCSR